MAQQDNIEAVPALPKTAIEHYEHSCQIIVDCQRRDTGLAETLKLGGLKRWRRKLAALRESVKPPLTRVEDLWEQACAEGAKVVVDGDDGSAMLEWLEGHRRQRKKLENALTVTCIRLESWRTKDIWTAPLPLNETGPSIE